MFKTFTRLFFPAFVFAVAVSGICPANADEAYNNVTNFTGSVEVNGGATGGITRMLLDDITPIATTPGDVTQVSFNVFNGNATAQSVRARIRFWFADGVGGGPGTYYDTGNGPIGYSFNPFTFGANSVTTLTGNLGPGFVMPQSKFWAGITFDNLGTTTGATDAELNNFGMGYFDPPTVGSSQDEYFITTAAGSFFNTNNPAGSFTVGQANPVGNFGWRFVTSGVAIPEPSSLACLVMGLAVFVSRSRRRAN